jgi:hypothetical protein
VRGRADRACAALRLHTRQPPGGTPVERRDAQIVCRRLDLECDHRLRKHRDRQQRAATPHPRHGDGLEPTELLALDAAGDLFVANLAGNSITEYAPNASGNAVPIAVLSGGVTQLSSPSAIALDATGRVYVANFASSGSYITVYHANPNGGVAPSQTIFDSVGFYQIAGLAVHGTTIYASVIDLAFNTEINEYPTTSNGIVSPSAQISGVGNPNGIAVEPNGKIVVADGSTIKVYAANANGGSPPLQTIAGSATHLNGPIGVALGSGEIFIADQSTPAITAYKITWTGDKAHLTDLTGTLTKLAAPVGIAFRP